MIVIRQKNRNKIPLENCLQILSSRLFNVVFLLLIFLTILLPLISYNSLLMCVSGLNMHWDMHVMFPQSCDNWGESPLFDTAGFVVMYSFIDLNADTTSFNSNQCWIVIRFHYCCLIGGFYPQYWLAVFLYCLQHNTQCFIQLWRRINSSVKISISPLLCSTVWHSFNDQPSSTCLQLGFPVMFC